MNTNIDLARKSIDRDNCKRYKKHYNKLKRRILIMSSISILSLFVLFIFLIIAYMYWWTNDNITTIQFSKYIFENYWWLIIFLLINVVCNIYTADNKQVLEEFEFNCSKMEYDFEQKYGESV